MHCIVWCFNDILVCDSSSAAVKTVIEVPMGSRSLRITAKGPDMIGEIMRINFNNDLWCFKALDLT